MRKYTFLALIFLLVACKGENDGEITITETVEQSPKLTKKDISNIKYTEILLDNKADKIAQDWSPYHTVLKAVEDLKLADYEFFKGNKDVFVPAFTELATTIPEDLNTAPIQARILALKTQSYRLRDELLIQPYLTTKHLELIKNVFVNFSNLNLQINKKIEKDEQVIIKPY